MTTAPPRPFDTPSRRARRRSQPNTARSATPAHCATQIVIPGEVISQAIRQAQHTLSHRHVGEHVIDEVDGALGHPAAAATRTHRATFAGERDEPVETAVATAKPREPVGEPAALEKVPKLLLHEAGQAFSLAQAGGVRAKGLEVIVHDLIEPTLRGMPKFVGCRARGHSRPASGHRASEEPDEIGLNARGRARR